MSSSNRRHSPDPFDSDIMCALGPEPPDPIIPAVKDSVDWINIMEVSGCSHLSYDSLCALGTNQYNNLLVTDIEADFSRYSKTLGVSPSKLVLGMMPGLDETYACVSPQAFAKHVKFTVDQG